MPRASAAGVWPSRSKSRNSSRSGALCRFLLRAAQPQLAHDQRRTEVPLHVARDDVNRHQLDLVMALAVFERERAGGHRAFADRELVRHARLASRGSSRTRRRTRPAATRAANDSRPQPRDARADAVQREAVQHDRHRRRATREHRVVEVHADAEHDHAREQLEHRHDRASAGCLHGRCGARLGRAPARAARARTPAHAQRRVGRRRSSGRGAAAGPVVVRALRARRAVAERQVRSRGAFAAFGARRRRGDSACAAAGARRGRRVRSARRSRSARRRGSARRCERAARGGSGCARATAAAARAARCAGSGTRTRRGGAKLGSGGTGPSPSGAPLGTGAPDRPRAADGCSEAAAGCDRRQVGQVRQRGQRGTALSGTASFARSRRARRAMRAGRSARARRTAAVAAHCAVRARVRATSERRAGVFARARTRCHRSPSTILLELDLAVLLGLVRTHRMRMIVARGAGGFELWHRVRSVASARARELRRAAGRARSDSRSQALAFARRLRREIEAAPRRTVLRRSRICGRRLRGVGSARQLPRRAARPPATARPARPTGRAHRSAPPRLQASPHA